MEMTTRRYPRTAREAFRFYPESCLGIEQPVEPVSLWRDLRAWFKLPRAPQPINTRQNKA